MSIRSHTPETNDITSPAPSRREQRRLETSERILDTAMRLLAKEGYEAFTIARLARELNYAVGALYRYFKGKDAIFAALQIRVIERIQREMALAAELVERRVLREQLEPEVAALTHVWAAMGVYESLTRRRPTDCELISLSLGDPRELIANELVNAGVMEMVQQVLMGVAARVERAAEVGVLEPGDSTQRTVVLWGSMTGMLQLRKLGRYDSRFSDRVLADELYGGLFIGWGAPKETVARSRRLTSEVLIQLGTPGEG